MSERLHDHEWVIRILNSKVEVYCLAHHDRACMMAVEEAEAMLNEHAALKRKLFEAGEYIRDWDGDDGLLAEIDALLAEQEK